LENKKRCFSLGKERNMTYSFAFPYYFLPPKFW
jgi:hypothetical protein